MEGRLLRMRLLVMTMVFVFIQVAFYAEPLQAANNQDLINRIVARARDSGSDYLTIIENGHTRYQGRFTQTEKLQDLQSVTKSISAIAVGILLDQGKIESLNEPMWHWIPSWRKHKQKSKITLKMILSQMSGLPDSSVIYTAPDRIDFAEHSDLVAEPGTKFIYSSVGSALLQCVIARAAGMSVSEFSRRQIFAPLGITRFEWHKDEAGQEKTGGALSMIPSDLAKIGTMLLNGGTYQGKTIMSLDSISKIRHKSQPHEDYGLMWWLKNPPGFKSNSHFHLFFADGWGGQYIVLYPAKNLVAIRTRDPANFDESHPEQAFGEFTEMIASWQ